MKLSVHLITWNGGQYIPFLCASLRNQTYKDWTLCILDNHSTDHTVALLQKELINFPVQSRLMVNADNKGFAGGHNQVYAQTDSEYFLLLNQDLYIAPDCFEKLMAAIEGDQHLAVVSPRLLQWNFSRISEDFEASLTTIIDSLGLQVLRNRRVIEIGGGSTWKDNESSRVSVFGVSGTMPLFRRASIKNIAFSEHEFFDASYGSYKEDVDLAYRLQAAGFGAAIITGAYAYHDRSAAGPKELSDTAAMKNKQQQSSWIQYHSYKNHLMTLYKNEYSQNSLLDFPWIFWYELKKFVWFMIFKPSVLRGLGEIWRARRTLHAKRIYIKKHRMITWRTIRTWWL